MPYEDNVKVYGNADIVWVLDKSGSMNDIIQAVENNVAQFATDLATSGQSPVKSLRLGLVTHDVEGRAEVWGADFAETHEEFVGNLTGAPSGGNEYGVSAIERALQFPWRDNCRRYILCITDEPAQGGHDPAGQAALIASVIEGIKGKHIYFLGFGPNCPDYEQIGLVPGCDYTACIPSTSDHGALTGLGFQKALQGLAATITS